MILFNKLTRTDLLLLCAGILLFILKAEAWQSVLTGFITVTFLISLANHIAHYRQTKKLY